MELKKCKKLGSNSTKAQRQDAHRVKMGIKKELRDRRFDQRGPDEYIFANISKHHEHWGDTPQEHYKRRHTL